MTNIELELVSDVKLDQAFCVLARTLAAGRRTHRAGAWRSKPVQKHLQHARKHLDLLASGPEGEDHLGHAACRLLMALEIRERTAKTRAAGPTSAEAANDSEQMPLFAGVAPTRQT
ncbi:MAG: dATP/dGTP diphosphohydrolase domain-containing protein [Candidatus Binataceae bacterium]